MKSLNVILSQTQNIKSQLEEFVSELNDRYEKMQESFDNRSEKWQESDAGEKYQQRMDLIQNARDYADCGEVDNLIDALEELRE